MLDFFAALVGWFGLGPIMHITDESVDNVTLIHGDESANLLGIMIPDG